MNINNNNNNKPKENEVDAGFLFNIVSRSEPEPLTLCVSSKRDSLCYTMQAQRKGRCIILNYKSFNSSDLRDRNGTERDAIKLRSTFQKMNFLVEVHNNLTHQETFEIFKSESTKDHSQFDCFVICILTHGSSGVLHTKDRSFDTNRMFEYFTGSRCPSLIGKPKLFFIQACQGEMLDSGVLVHDAPSEAPSYFMIPNYADFLIFYSTFPGHYSWRNVQEGSWFIQTLCSVLDQLVGKHDLMTLLTIVCQKVAFDYESRVPNDPIMHKKKQIPCIMSTLTRLVYL